MDYNDFDKHIHALILELGFEYFKKGAVTDLRETKAGWKAVVKGQNDYEVVLDGVDGLEAWICDCPYDHGPVCKHVASTLYALKDKISTDLKPMLDELDTEALSELIVGQALRSRSVAKSLDRQLRNE